jgi:hypothetical protein
VNLGLVRDDVEWGRVVRQIASDGWARITAAVPPDAGAALERAAPGPWSSLPETEGGAGVRQAGRACHHPVDRTAGVVHTLADAIVAGIDGARIAGIDPLPAFNHAEWCRAEEGRKYITAHCDPDRAGGVIAILTIRGRAVFRVWDLDGPVSEVRRQPERATAWETEAGDLVLLRGGGWPRPASRCPVHEAESPREGDRITLTLRHNTGGYGADYFA